MAHFVCMINLFYWTSHFQAAGAKGVCARSVRAAATCSFLRLDIFRSEAILALPNTLYVCFVWVFLNVYIMCVWLKMGLQFNPLSHVWKMQNNLRWQDFQKAFRGRAAAKFEAVMSWRRDNRIDHIIDLPHPKFFIFERAYPFFIHGRSKGIISPLLFVWASCCLLYWSISNFQFSIFNFQFSFFSFFSCVSFTGFPFENRCPIRYFDLEHYHRIILTSETIVKCSFAPHRNGARAVLIMFIVSALRGWIAWLWTSLLFTLNSCLVL